MHRRDLGEPRKRTTTRLSQAMSSELTMRYAHDRGLRAGDALRFSQASARVLLQLPARVQKLSEHELCGSVNAILSCRAPGSGSEGTGDILALRGDMCMPIEVKSSKN